MLKPQRRLDQLQFHDLQFTVVAADEIDARIRWVARNCSERGLGNLDGAIGSLARLFVPTEMRLDATPLATTTRLSRPCEQPSSPAWIPTTWTAERAHPNGAGPTSIARC